MREALSRYTECVSAADTGVAGIPKSDAGENSGMNSSHSRAHLEAFSAVVMMGTVPVVIKWMQAGPWVIGFIRLVIALSLLLLLFPKAREFRGLKWRDWRILGVIGLVFGLHWVTYFFAIKLSSASLAAIGTVSMYGIFLSLMGAIFLAHRVRWYHVAAIGLSIVGTMLVVGEFTPGSGGLLGFLFAVISGFLYALLPILHQRTPHLSSMQRTTGQYGGGLLVFMLAIPFGDWQLSTSDWWCLLYLGTVATLALQTLWVLATSVLPSTTSSLIYYLYVPIAVILSYLILGETLSLSQIIGALIVFSGSLLGMLGGRFGAN